MSSTKTEVEVKRENLFNVPFSNLQIVEGLNIRSDYGDINELADSIIQNGIQVPTKGFFKEGFHYIVHGHRRFTAGKLINDTAVAKPVKGGGMEVEFLKKKYFFGEKEWGHFVVTEKGKVEIIFPFQKEGKGIDDNERVIDMVLTNTGKALNPLELAEVVKRLLNASTEENRWDEKRIAEKLSMTPLYVSRLNLLNAAPAKFKKLIMEEKISGTTAIKVAGEGKIDSFLKDFDGGKYEHVLKEKKGKAGKITAKHIEINSMKFFKKFSDTAEVIQMSPVKKESFDFIHKILNNEISTKDFHDYFYN